MCETIEEIQNLVNVKLDQDTNYDLEIALQNIHKYIRHLMRDSQQKKAKSEAFDELSESTGFSLKVVSTTFLLVCFVYLKESTCETRKNVFYFTSKGTRNFADQNLSRIFSNSKIHLTHNLKISLYFTKQLAIFLKTFIDFTNACIYIF